MIAFGLAMGAGAASLLDDPVRAGASSPADAGVVIGIERYAFVPTVPYAERDAEAAYEFLLYTRGVPQDKLQKLTNASREQILRAVQQAAEEVEAGGTLWLYYAGHGAASPEDGSRMWLGVDVMADEAVFSARAVHVEEVSGIAAASRAERVLMVMDTCYGGVGRSGAELLPGTRFAVPAYATQKSNKVTMWSAASANELSAPYPQEQHGLFTTFALGAMRGWADGEISGEPDGTVTLAEAKSYVERALRSVGERAQTPTVEQKKLDLGMTLGSGRLEEGPSLEKLAPKAAAPVVVPTVAATSLGDSDDYAARLQQMRETQAERSKVEAERAKAHDRAVADASDPVRDEAVSMWRETEQIVAGGGPEGEIALRTFIDRYEGAEVVVDGVREPIVVPQVEEARTILETYDPKVLTPKELRQRKLLQSSLAVGGAALLSMGGATLAKWRYVEAPPTAGELKGLYGLNQGLAYGGYTLSAVSLGLAVAARF